MGSNSPLLSVQFVTIMEMIGSIINSLSSMITDQPNTWHLQHYTKNAALEVLQQTELIAKATLETIRVLHRQIELSRLFITCSEKLNQLYSTMFSSSSPTLDDAFTIFICLHIATLDTFRLSSWLEVFDSMIEIGCKSELADPVKFLLSLRYVDIERRLSRDHLGSTETWTAELPDQENVFCSDDLDIHTLAYIKDFRIEWTFDITLHLTIASGHIQRTGEKNWKKKLYIYWFPPPWGPPVDQSYLSM
jgi:hypothetical protein